MLKWVLDALWSHMLFTFVNIWEKQACILSYGKMTNYYKLHSASLMFSFCILSSSNYLLSSPETDYQVFGLIGTKQWIAHEIVFGNRRLLCHLDTNPHQTRAALLCVHQSAVHCVSSWALARDICTEKQTTRTDLPFPCEFSTSSSARRAPLSFLF